MKVTVKLHGSLRRYRPASAGGAPHQAFSLLLPEGETVAGLINHLHVPEGMVSGVAVNRELAVPDTLLQEEDVVYLFPPSAGG